MERKTQFSVGYFAVAVLAILLLQNAWVGMRTIAPLPYSEFQTLLRENKVAEIAVADNLLRFSLPKQVENNEQEHYSNNDIRPWNRTSRR